MGTGEQKATGRAARLARPIWVVLGVSSLGLAAIGVILPVLPTTPLVILAAFCFSRGSPRLEAWLVRNRLFGPILRDWRQHGAIAPRYKLIAVSMMAAVLIYSLVSGAPVWVLALQIALIGVGAGYVLSRPNGT